MNRTKLFVWVSALFIAGLVYSQTRIVTDPQTFIDELLASVLSPESPPPFNLPLVASNAVPESATFWSAQANEDSPPYPFNPVADLGLPVYSLGNNSFLFDDRAVNYDAWNQVQSALRQLASGMTMDSLEFPDDGTNENGGWTNNFVSPVYTTNDLWLEWLAESVTNGTGTIALHIPDSYGDAAWDLFATTNLSVNTEADALNVTNWLWLARTTAAQTNLTVNFIWSAEAYFRLAATNDYDADGLTDAFETLVSHSNASTNDTDGDGLLDAWEWTHFGNFAQTDTGDYDNDSTDNLAEQTAGSDPNTLVFTLSVTNTHVNGPATVTADLTGGVPYAFAVMVDATNFTAPNWSLYASSNLIVDLGATDGWHDVWVALRGRVPTNHVNWQWQRLKRDTIAPTLTLTNPTPTTSWPLIQVQGLSDEDLADISYTLGTVTNERVFVLDRHYATNTHEFTTNRFQAFDVELAEGTNTFSLRATDLAGNVTATNFPFILAPDTTAPAITLTWPQPDARIGADTFTLRGWLDDPTARVTASLVSTNGVTNVYSAVVERHGRFWLENLPLSAGTNSITLTAVDAWTNAMTTNFNVVRSSVQVTIAPPTSDLWASCVNVSGTVSDASHTVWVNGGPATMAGTNWTACVNVGSGGMAGVSASAYPPGGEPSGGGGGSGGGEENPLNPPGSGAVTAELQLEKPARFYVESYTMARQDQERIDGEYVYDTGNGPEPIAFTSDESGTWSVTWQDGAGGAGGWQQAEGFVSPVTNRYDTMTGQQQWPASRWAELPDGWQVVNGWGASLTTNNAGPAPVFMEHCNVQTRQEWLNNTVATAGEPSEARRVRTYARQADAVVKLFTGGRSVAQEKTLWELTGSATEILDPWAQPPYGSEVPTRSIPPERISLGTHGRLDTNALLLAAAPQGSTTEVTLKADSSKINASNVSGRETKLKILWGTQDITDRTTNEAVVGQVILLTITVDPPDIETYRSLTNFEWTVTGKKLADYHISTETGNTAGYPVPLTDVTNRSVKFFWHDKGTELPITCLATLRTGGMDVPIKAETRFTVHRPSAKWEAHFESDISVDALYTYYALHLGGDVINSGTNRGFVAEFSEPFVTGTCDQPNFVVMQMVDFRATIQWAANNSISNVFSSGLDTAYPLRVFTNSSGFYEDSPGHAVGPLTKLYREDRFECYLFFRPGFGDSARPVPLRRIKWNWSGTAEKINDDWILLSSPTSRTITVNNEDVTEYPTWSNNATNLSYALTNSF